MPLKDWFAAKRRRQPNGNAVNAPASGLSADAANERLSDEEYKRLWTQCPQCQARMTKKELAANLLVCPQCDYHMRIGARQRITQLCDSFEELNAELTAGDPLAFTDTQPYSERQYEARTKTGLNEAVITGLAQMKSQAGEARFALGVMDFAYMGGSMGSVVGEKITRLIERALQEDLPLVIVSSSGGARMQEGTLSLMQMVKTGAALSRLHEAGLLFVSVLTEPTFGGVTASFAMLGDVILAEQGARIGFAGRRVIEQTIRQKLPADFQTASYLERYGQVDGVMHRARLKEALQTLIRLHQPVADGHTKRRKPASSQPLATTSLPR